MADLLIQETETKVDDEQLAKADKKSSKNKRKKRNKTKQNKEDTVTKSIEPKVDVDSHL